MNFLDKFGLEIVSNIGDLCLKDQEDKREIILITWKMASV